jgi:hypothetical protein
MYSDTGDANQGQNRKQQEFGRVVRQAVKDIGVYRAP